VIVDSSALLAVILNEADEARFLDAMIDAPALRMSAGNWLESGIVIDSMKNGAVKTRFEDPKIALGSEVVPVTEDAAFRGRIAHNDFGGGNHPAKRNYGDCFAYALAALAREPLLFKGNDFSQTDIEPALKD
jgi:ribonuclease VapC